MLSPDKAVAPAAETPKPAATRFKLQSSTVIPLTNEELIKFRSIESGMLERDLSKTRIAHLKQKALAGLLVSFHWVIVTIRATNKVVRGNGQHSSQMLVELGENMPTDLKVHLEHYEVPDGDGFAELFQQFDDRKSARQQSDIASVYQGLNPPLINIPKRVGKISVDGYIWYSRFIQGVSTRVGDMKYSAFSDEGLHPFFHWMATVLADKKGTKELTGQPVVGAMFATYNANESAAKLFWENVAAGGDPDQSDLPETVLSQWLVAMDHGKIERGTQKEVYQGCIYCWNASREDKRVSSVRFAVKTTPTSPRE